MSLICLGEQFKSFEISKKKEVYKLILACVIITNMIVKKIIVFFFGLIFSIIQLYISIYNLDQTIERVGVFFNFFRARAKRSICSLEWRTFTISLSLKLA